MASILDQLGIRSTPWVIRVYLALFLCLLLVLVFTSKTPPSPLSRDAVEALPSTKLFALAADGLKTVLGALLGSLSVAATGKFKAEQGEPDRRKR
jgi:hypothetical protein